MFSKIIKSKDFVLFSPNLGACLPSIFLELVEKSEDCLH